MDLSPSSGPLPGGLFAVADLAADELWQVLLPFGVALAVGLLVGIERERHHNQRAGVRTFGIASLAGCLAAAVSPTAVAAVVVAVGALAAVGHWLEADSDPGATTEVALLIAPLLGATAWYNPTAASAAGVLVAVLLAAKDPLHRFAREVVSDQEIDDALMFFVAAVVVLPLLPSGPHGPYGVLDPQRIWWIVVALAAVGWAGYIATRILGARRGLLVTGLAGGFVSATATTAAMARRAREPGLFRPALAAAMLANAATLIQLEIVTSVVSLPVARAFLPAVVVGCVVSAGVALVLAWRAPVSADTEAPTGRPLAWRPILAVTAVLTASLLLGRWATDVLGPSGAVAVSALSGLADAHAGALAAANLHAAGQLPLAVAVAAGATALLTNLGVKTALAITTGGLRVGLSFLGLVLVPAAAVAVTLVLTV
jgi:uncharacterized membrane protein (DUF4010 family)